MIAQTSWVPLVIVSTQVTLGVFAVLNSPNHEALLWLGVTHQFVAMMLLLSLVFEFYLVNNKKTLMTQ